MGSYTYCDVVPYAIQYLYGYDSCNPHNTTQQQKYLAEPLDAIAGEFATDEEPTTFLTLTVNGWTYKGEAVAGKKKDLWGFEWIKDDFTVCLINESDYSAGGAIELSAVADDEQSLIEFKKDMQALFEPYYAKHQHPIEKNIALKLTC